jgi:hypothetical protein
MLALFGASALFGRSEQILRSLNAERCDALGLVRTTAWADPMRNALYHAGLSLRCVMYVEQGLTASSLEQTAIEKSLVRQCD